MGKIPNWHRTQSKEKKKIPYKWRHDEIDARVQVVKTSPSSKNNGMWIVNHNAFFNRQSNKVIARSDTKEGARKKAVEWMKNHQDGTR